jgi:opacity protein-like surface antigen
MKRTLLSGTAALMMAAPAAFAGNLEPVVVEPETIVAVTPTYAGGDWTGGYAGLQLGYADADATTAGGLNLNGDDTTYGVHVGYNYDFGQWVVGGEVDYDSTDIDLAGAATVDDVTRLKFKTGYDLGRTLVYATAGAAHVSTSIGDDTGAFGGLGMNYAVSDQFLIGGEVLYHDFSDIDGAGTDADATTVTLRGSFRF